MSPVESRHDRPGGYDDGGPAVTELEGRYARWTALFYPADYRRERGSGLMDTYLSLAAPGRKRPRPATSRTSRPVGCDSTCGWLRASVPASGSPACSRCR